MKNKTINVYDNPIESMEFSVNEYILNYNGSKARSLRTGFEISINKWRAIILDPTITQNSGGVDTCGLCHLYHTQFTKKDCCYGCPVREETGSYYCEGTPFIEWELLDNSTEAAEAEFNFLVNLAIKNGYAIKFESNKEGE